MEKVHGKDAYFKKWEKVKKTIREHWEEYGNIFKATPEEVLEAANRIKEHRKSIGNLTQSNFGYLEGTIPNVTIDNKKFWRTTSYSLALEEIHIFDAISVAGSNGKSWSRIVDTEYRMLNKLASDLGAVKGIKYPNIVGELKIISENPYCTSCVGIIQQFNDMFPNIKLILIDGAK